MRAARRGVPGLTTFGQVLRQSKVPKRQDKGPISTPVNNRDHHRTRLLRSFTAMITKRTVSLLALALASALSLRANDVTGTITIQHKLTKPRVTPTGDLYERGVAVP